MCGTPSIIFPSLNRFSRLEEVRVAAVTEVNFSAGNKVGFHGRASVLSPVYCSKTTVAQAGRTRLTIFIPRNTPGGTFILWIYT